MKTHTIAPSLLLLLHLPPAPAFAESPPDVLDPPVASDGQKLAAMGAVVPRSSGDGRAFGQVVGTVARGAGAHALELLVDGRLAGSLALRAGVYAGSSGETSGGNVGLLVTALRQERHAVDAAAGLMYRSLGWNGVPELRVMASVSRRGERALMLVNLGYGQGLRENERNVELRVGSWRRLGRFHVGVDARARADVEKVHQPGDEPRFDMLAGPVLTCDTGLLAVAVQPGIAVLQLNRDAAPRAGPALTLAIGSSF